VNNKIICKFKNFWTITAVTKILLIYEITPESPKYAWKRSSRPVILENKWNDGNIATIYIRDSFVFQTVPLELCDCRI
jgi:hypothetical protein